MKKTFPFQIPGQDTSRVAEGIKQTIRKYLKRERRKALPEGVDFWDFDCRIGLGQQPPVLKHVAELISAIDQAAQSEVKEVYVEILAKPGVRTKKSNQPKSPTPDASH
jgi:hypothetical protein